ncbi:hypothetical protein BURPS406E_A0296 [Burkholderia pseudomallei 406e]|uniref:Uncharacterized protein n=2 Tax=Burkholderia pseudomallei TaxID=28450 RepID=A0A0E1WKA4_BURPE|nr:hypothetical protein BURPS668_0095 [Burkholderia pseudomallei 668]ABN89352.1 hypothetical protein BURPS1106A_0109 [Burkholderia pseudomallei 1106a]ABO04118.1 hypothetical protein BMA10247_3548 [Burkholderia mallei NCTC 10247]ACQ95116.1 conserved hypothetical protein [Burkholderia pseudomallei MSHR346]EDO85840.1 hypothetical protein BURPS406E_A0296 [Burkholderia pseudomallei 406e]EDO89980.1 hypothetical protein BURPSPAST_Y0334 [Burkholderia pseudomallei Pasteur 52237]EDP86200.1 hypothetical
MLAVMTQIEMQSEFRRAGHFFWTAQQGEFETFGERRFFFVCRHGQIVQFDRCQEDNQSGYV